MKPSFFLIFYYFITGIGGSFFFFGSVPKISANEVLLEDWAETLAGEGFGYYLGGEIFGCYLGGAAFAVPKKLLKKDYLFASSSDGGGSLFPLFCDFD